MLHRLYPVTKQVESNVGSVCELSRRFLSVWNHANSWANSRTSFVLKRRSGAAQGNKEWLGGTSLTKPLNSHHHEPVLSGENGSSWSSPGALWRSFMQCAARPVSAEQLSLGNRTHRIHRCGHTRRLLAMSCVGSWQKNAADIIDPGGGAGREIKAHAGSNSNWSSFVRLQGGRRGMKEEEAVLFS